MFKNLRRTLRFIVLTFFGASTAQTAPWIKPTDITARQNVEYLASTGVIRSPISQWPLMWGSVLPDLRAAQHRKLDGAQKRAVDQLMAQFSADSAPRQFRVSGGWADQQNTLFGGFGNSNNAPQYGSVSAAFVSSRWAGELNVGYDVPDFTWEHRKLDQSYLAGAFGNWGLTVGAIDRWWGPGWQSSLILSNNARPLPGLSIQRNRATPFDSFLLSWLGNWQLQAFAAQLESNRFVPKTKLLGARFSVKPAQWLELGFSRTAQWGGDGRPENFSTFKDLIVGKDNRGDSGVTQENEPGNQLAGMDAKISFPVPWGSQGIYAQLIGEDEAGYAPSRYIYMAGVDGTLIFGSHRLNWFFERSDTTANALSDEKRFNYTYEHSVYQSGYRYRGRPIGASVDGDASINTFGASWTFPNFHQLRLKASSIDLNYDGGKAPGDLDFGGFGEVLEASYVFTLLQVAQIEVGYRSVDETIRASGLSTPIDTAFIEATLRW